MVSRHESVFRKTRSQVTTVFPRHSDKRSRTLCCVRGLLQRLFLERTILRFGQMPLMTLTVQKLTTIKVADHYTFFVRDEKRTHGVAEIGLPQVQPNWTGLNSCQIVAILFWNNDRNPLLLICEFHEIRCMEGAISHF
jgi:hypothetical protein